jgi:hypothetical protein
MDVGDAQKLIDLNDAQFEPMEAPEAFKHW